MTQTGHLLQGQAYSLPMVFQNGRWVPARRLSIPYHHSYRLELSNWRSFPKLRKGASGAKGNASGSAKGNASGNAKGAASGSAKGNASGSAKGNASGSQKSNASGSQKSNASGSQKSNAKANASGSTKAQAKTTAKGQRQVILEIIKVKIQKVPRQRRWWATYRARVLRVR